MRRWRPPVRRGYCSTCKASTNQNLHKSGEYYICVGDRRRLPPIPACKHQYWIEGHGPISSTDSPTV